MIYFFYGDDSFSLLAALKSHQEKFLEKNPRGTIRQQEFTPDLRQLREVIASQGLFASGKLVILRDFVNELNKYPAMEEYLSEIITGESSVEIIFAESAVDRRLRFFKKLVKAAQSKQFSIPEGKALQEWIRSELARRGMSIEPAAMAKLLQNLGEDYDLWQVKNELDKLILYKSPSALSPLVPSDDGIGGDEEGVITVSDIQKVASRNLTKNVFALTDSVGRGDLSAALKVFQELDGEPVQVVGALAAQIRSLLLVKGLEQNSSAEIAKILGWKEGRVWINLKLAKNFSRAKLVGLLSDLRAIDRRLKSSEEPPKLLLTLFLQKAKA